VTRRILAMLFLGLTLPALIAADEPSPEPGDAPPRLKRKKRADPAPPKAEKKAPDKEAPKAKEEEPLVPEDGGKGGEPEEDEKDILERINKNMRAVEEKLGSRELGEPIRQQQSDILRDIDKLIKKSENPPQGGGGGGQPPPQGGEDEKQGQDKDKSQSKSKAGGQGGQQGSKGMAKGGRRQSRQQRQARGSRKGGRQGTQTARNQPGGAGQPKGNAQPNPKGGNPGAGGSGKADPPEAEKRALNDQWGHLPESLRAEMNAYSNPQPFLPRYDRLIREYYKTIAEQGRKKGD
jgi:hypothetical protein